VSIFSFFVPSGRTRTLPVTLMTLSLWSREAVSNSSAGRSLGSNTAWVRPSRSRMSM